TRRGCRSASSSPAPPAALPAHRPAGAARGTTGRPAWRYHPSCFTTPDLEFPYRGTRRRTKPLYLWLARQIFRREPRRRRLAVDRLDRLFPALPHALPEELLLELLVEPERLRIDRRMGELHRRVEVRHRHLRRLHVLPDRDEARFAA